MKILIELDLNIYEDQKEYELIQKAKKISDVLDEFGEFMRFLDKHGVTHDVEAIGDSERKLVNEIRNKFNEICSDNQLSINDLTF